MNTKNSINESLEIIRRALEDERNDTNKDSTSNILILNQKVNSDGTIKLVQKDHDINNEINDIIDQKLSYLVESKIEKILDEKIPQLLKNYFGAGNTKVYIEKMCKFYSDLGLKTTAIRHSNVFGPYDKFDLEKSHVLGATVRKVLQASEGDTINVWGSGKARRDFIFISDLINFIIKAYKNQENLFGLYNCGMGYSISINELVQKIILVSEKQLTMKNDLQKPDIPTALSLDCTKAKNELQWINQTSFDEALAKTYYWAKNNING